MEVFWMPEYEISLRGWINRKLQYIFILCFLNLQLLEQHNREFHIGWKDRFLILHFMQVQNQQLHIHLINNREIKCYQV